MKDVILHTVGIDSCIKRVRSNETAMNIYCFMHHKNTHGCLATRAETKKQKKTGKDKGKGKVVPVIFFN